MAFKLADKVAGDSLTDAVKKGYGEVKNKIYKWCGWSHHLRGNNTHVANAATCQIYVETETGGGFGLGVGEYTSYPSDNPELTVTRMDNQLVVCKKHKLVPDQSVIVTKNNTIQLTKYGEIWIDVNGKDHRR
ncbi:hypothetical protein SNE40_003946 [Patella caerulea]|uniref:Uncharacterized protein n=1 Tax=Patella caerulea TaxID=87958 RepID=A0AAN8KJD6_PATCE